MQSGRIGFMRLEHPHLAEVEGRSIRAALAYPSDPEPWKRRLKERQFYLEQVPTAACPAAANRGGHHRDAPTASRSGRVGIPGRVAH